MTQEIEIINNDDLLIDMDIIDEPWVCSKKKCGKQTSIFMYAFVIDGNKNKWCYEMMIKSELMPKLERPPSRLSGYYCLEHVLEFLGILGVSKEELGYILI